MYIYIYTDIRVYINIVIHVRVYLIIFRNVDEEIRCRWKLLPKAWRA